MAEGQSSHAPAPPAESQSSDQNRGGRRRGRGGAHRSAPADRQNQDDGRTDGPVRGNRSRGRGGQKRQQNRSQASEVNAVAGDATEVDTKGKVPVVAATDDADDGKICFICASTVEHTSVSPCNHRTCHICALRLRALYKNKACAHCRTESSFVIFTDDPAKRFEDFTNADFARSDDNLGIKYEKEEIFEDTVLLLRYNCPGRTCDVACLGWPDLHHHVKTKHGRVMCDLCTRNKKVFTHEHELFTMAELRRHEKYGDDVPGSIDQSGFKGHPECKFCRERFYSSDELYVHLRDRHERCHICDRQSGNTQPNYYINYDDLEKHFQKDHFLCLEKECLEKKFVVFESLLDLKAHQLEAHPNGLSKDARRDARMVDMSSFDFRAPYQPGRQRRGAGRGRDPNSEPLPTSSAQPLRRDEVAYQRQMAIQSAQSVSTRSFGGQLTRNDPQTVPASARSSSTAPMANPAPTRAPPVAEMENLGITANLTPQERARRLRHTAVIERAANLLQNDATKVADFRTKVSKYRTSAISATELIDSFFSLFDTSSSELGKLVKELAEVYEDEAKRTALLKAWNDWRAINEDYPSLPGPSGIIPGLPSSTDNNGRGIRILHIKNSTAQSSRSAVGRAGALGATPAFPPLPSSSSSRSRSSGRSQNNSRRGSFTTTPWGLPSVPAPRPVVSAAPRGRSTPNVPTAASRLAGPATGAVNNTASSEAFPALPPAARPNFRMAGLTRGTGRWDDMNGRPLPNAWGASSAASPTTAEDPESAGNNGGKKGNKGKKGKQTLMHFG